MTTVNSVDNGSSNVTDVSDRAKWDDSKHSGIVDFFHKHFSKVTEDVVSVGDDIKKEFEGIKKMVGDGENIVTDFESAVKDEGFKTAVQDVIENTLGGKNPLDGIATPEHMAAIKGDVTKLENILDQLKIDGKPLEGDIVTAIEKGKGIVTDVMDLARQGMAIYGGDVNPAEFGEMLGDIKDIVKCLEAALQMNSTATSNGNSTNSKPPKVTVSGAGSNPNQQVNNLYAVDMLKATQTDTDNQTQDKRDHHRHHHHHHQLHHHKHHTPRYERVNV